MAVAAVEDLAAALVAADLEEAVVVVLAVAALEVDLIIADRILAITDVRASLALVPVITMVAEDAWVV